EGTSFSTADVAGDVHLRTGLGKREVGGAEPDFCIGTEHLSGKKEECLLQICKRYILVNVKRFHLMKETVSTIGDRLIAVHPSRADDADGRFCLFHHPGLYGGGVCT